VGVPRGGKGGFVKKVVREVASLLGGGAAATDAPRRDFQKLWFALARNDWRSVVFVPGDEGGSAASAATALADVGKKLHELPVILFVMANPADYWPAMQMVHAAADLAGEAEAQRRPPKPLDYASAVQVVTDTTARHRALRPPTGKVIVAVQSVISEPLGLAVTQAADAVVLHVELARTRLASLRTTIELVGRERIAGCILDRGASRTSRG
jgi:hypothetical protein